MLSRGDNLPEQHQKSPLLKRFLHAVDSMVRDSKNWWQTNPEKEQLQENNAGRTILSHVLSDIPLGNLLSLDLYVYDPAVEEAINKVDALIRRTLPRPTIIYDAAMKSPTVGEVHPSGLVRLEDDRPHGKEYKERLINAGHELLHQRSFRMLLNKDERIWGWTTIKRGEFPYGEGLDEAVTMECTEQLFGEDESLAKHYKDIHTLYKGMCEEIAYFSGISTEDIHALFINVMLHQEDLETYLEKRNAIETKFNHTIAAVLGAWGVPYDFNHFVADLDTLYRLGPKNTPTASEQGHHLQEQQDKQYYELKKNNMERILALLQSLHVSNILKS